MPEFDVYTRQGCHLCEVLIEQLLELVGQTARLRIHDVDSSDDWQAHYGSLVPVVEYEGRQLCHYKLDAAAIRAALAGRS
tara:strand:- start:9721 stop:9960 length:240 start_codon:yes stop_codon:yes gene_type:complete